MKERNGREKKPNSISYLCKWGIFRVASYWVSPQITSEPTKLGLYSFNFHVTCVFLGLLRITLG